MSGVGYVAIDDIERHLARVELPNGTTENGRLADMVNGDNLTGLTAVRPKNVMVSVVPNIYGHSTEQALVLYR